MLASESGTVFWRPALLEETARNIVKEFIEKTAYKIKFSNYIEFFGYWSMALANALDGYGGGMACSHIVAATYLACHAIELTKPLTQYVPNCFSEDGDVRWLVNVGCTKMVLGYDTSTLIRLYKK